MKLITILSQDNKDLVKNLNPEPFQFFNKDVVHFRSYLLCEIAGEIAGMVIFTEKSMFNPDMFGISVVTVQPKFKNKGIASFLVDSLFKLAELHGKGIRVTPYEPEGLLYLKPVIHRIGNQYDVEFVEA